MSLIRGLFNVIAATREASVVPAIEALPEGERPVRLLFWCPGCRQAHGPTVGSPLGGGPRWTWNGDYVKPTFQPSLLVQWDSYKPEARARDDAYRQQHGEYPNRSGRDPADWFHNVCHSFIGCNGAAPGQIVFLSDCTHALAGQTVDIPPFAWRDDEGESAS